MSKVQNITGTITLEDGTTSEFSVSAESYSQWGAERSRLGITVDVLTAFQFAVSEHDDGYEDEDEDEEEDDGAYGLTDRERNPTLR